jgi:hypothetical protein
MAGQVTVRRTIESETLIFTIEEGLEEKIGLVFKLPIADASLGADSRATTGAALRRLGGEAWNTGRAWVVVDEHGNLIDEFKAL